MRLAASLIFTAAIALLTFPAAATTHHRHHRASHAVRSYASQPQIACTVVGCIPVPRGCHPEMGYTPDGTPTGFDVAVCGNATLYGNRR